MATTGCYTVEYTRYGVLLYYPARSYEDAKRFINVYERLGEIKVLNIVTPTGRVLDSI